ncbi:ATP-dependent zinc metalloprotease FTSH 12 [Hibiscus syriacus]|uniref:ATP-dependent zinc metalloprotease FTSH 12 n=1 Tax=Hibiscus syriacus TaxID=106335 RepID=A0A6A2ZP20_HIBSY|nr:ATP-dependent zinc metalloprotease FTSH 12 [Hibiscus syriacus]
MAYAENFILPVGNVGETKSMYKEVVLGGDVWDLLDELMIYMGNPMQYYEKGVQFVRGVLLSGPPGTGKTLFARTLAKESGLPFVFASGAEFTDSEKSGAARINEMFSIARRNAPAFVFVDEIDAIAGRHARKDPRRRATFEALIAQLDGEKEKTGVDRFSLRQAVIFICATNRPDELDLEFVRAGRIDRRLYIGLPDAKQRVQIFGVHSAGKLLAEDVNFEQLVFRTVVFSGADIRNLVNEAAIMSVRKGHSNIFQQDIIDVLDKQLLEGMGVLLTEEEQQKCEASETAISVFYPREDMVDQADSSDGELIKYRWDDPHVIPANMTPEVSELFTRELTRYIEETEELTINALKDNRHILDMIANELLEKSRITGLEVEEKIKGLSPVRFEDFVKPFQINLDEEGPLPHNDRLRYQPLDIYPAPLHRC